MARTRATMTRAQMQRRLDDISTGSAELTTGDRAEAAVLRDALSREDEAPRKAPEFEFQSKVPHKTMWLVVRFPTPEVERLLKLAGWAKQPEMFHGHDPEPQDTFVSPGSTGEFGQWTPAERRSKMADARKVASAMGHGPVHHRPLTLADML